MMCFVQPKQNVFFFFLIWCRKPN